MQNKKKKTIICDCAAKSDSKVTVPEKGLLLLKKIKT